MIQLTFNADQKVNDLVMTNTVQAHYLAVCEQYSKGHLHVFNSEMQVLMTKLGIIVAKVSNGPQISYCAQSLDYLCKTVLNDNTYLPRLFARLKLNSNGNDEKHAIKEDEDKGYMEECVKAYNLLVDSIASKYHLTSLKKLIVKKKEYHAPRAPQQPQNQYPRTPNRNFPPQGRPNADSHPHETAATADERLKLRAELERGDGRYVKGIFNKTGMVNFRLNVKIDNPDNLKITKVTAILKCGKNQTEKNVSTATQSTTEFDLPTSEYSGNIEVSVIAIYKIGFMSSKQIKTTVSKNF